MSRHQSSPAIDEMNPLAFRQPWRFGCQVKIENSSVVSIFLHFDHKDKKVYIFCSVIVGFESCKKCMQHVISWRFEPQKLSKSIYVIVSDKGTNEVLPHWFCKRGKLLVFNLLCPDHIYGALLFCRPNSHFGSGPSCWSTTPQHSALQQCDCSSDYVSVPKSKTAVS